LSGCDQNFIRSIWWIFEGSARWSWKLERAEEVSEFFGSVAGENLFE